MSGEKKRKHSGRTIYTVKTVCKYKDLMAVIFFMEVMFFFFSFLSLLPAFVTQEVSRTVFS